MAFWNVEDWFGGEVLGETVIDRRSFFFFTPPPVPVPVPPVPPVPMESLSKFIFC